MTTTVQTAAAAENIGSGLAWADTTNSLIDDALSASVTFDGTNSDSQLLWVHDFGFTFPTTELSIDGISAKVLRTGTGLTEDLQVVLTHGATPTLTSPSKHQAGTWVSDVDGTTNYGGVSDIWNRVWSGSEVNDSNFGFAISAESTMNFDAGLVDFVELIPFFGLFSLPETGTYALRMNEPMRADQSQTIETVIAAPIGGISSPLLNL
mgnify:CR=1 FL=1